MPYLQKVYGKLIKEINFTGGKVVFDYQNSRKDVTGGASLEKITLRNELGIIRNISLVHSYFKSQRGFDPFMRANGLTDSTLLYRLCLNEVVFESGDPGTDTMKYAFSYLNGNGLPGRLSASQDLYGFNNGETNSYMLTNAETEYPMNYYNLGYPRRYGDRGFSPSFMPLGLLNKIVYPTGGSDSITYDYNKKDEQYIQRNTETLHFGVVGKDVPDDLNVMKGNFSVTIPQEVLLKVNVINITDPPIEDWRLHQKGYIVFKNTTTGEIPVDMRVSLLNPRLEKPVFLPAGNYETTLRVEGGAVLNVYTVFTYELRPPDTLTRKVPMGGMRVNEIISYDPVGNDTLRKFYRYDGTFSILANARTGYVNSVVKFMNCEGAYDCSGSSSCRYFVHSHNTSGPTSLVGGNILYHRYVSEFTIGRDSIEQTIEHKFVYNDVFMPGIDHGGVIANTPYGIYPDLLIGETETIYSSYNRLTDKKKLQKRTINSYLVRRRKIVTNFVVDKSYDSPCLSDPPSSVEYDAYKINSYPIFNVENKLQSGKDLTYTTDAGNDSVEVSTSYEYTAYAPLLPNKITTISSKQEAMSKTYKYCFDAVGDTVAALLTERNKLVPVEIATFKGSERLTRDIIGYKTVDRTRGIVEVAKVDRQNGTYPVYTVSEIQSFDNYGHPLTVLENNMPNSFIWDYQKCYVTAAARNTSINDIAYTSFEADGKGNWVFAGTPVTDGTAPTGRRCYPIAGNITRSGLNSNTTYIVSYWRKGGTVTVNGTAGSPGRTTNGWTYYEHRIANPSGGVITVSGTSGFIDELKLYPGGAQMNSYTYDPLIGVINQTDPMGQSSYFEYDGFGRFKLIKDQNGKILKQYDYQYQKPITQ